MLAGTWWSQLRSLYLYYSEHKHVSSTIEHPMVTLGNTAIEHSMITHISTTTFTSSLAEGVPPSWP